MDEDDDCEANGPNSHDQVSDHDSDGRAASTHSCSGSVGELPHLEDDQEASGNDQGAVVGQPAPGPPF